MEDEFTNKELSVLGILVQWGLYGHLSDPDTVSMIRQIVNVFENAKDGE